MEFKYTLKEKSIIKKIRKSPYFWSLDRNGNRHNLALVSLSRDPGKVFCSEILNPLLNNEAKYSVYDDVMDIEDLYNRHHPYEWIKDKDFAKSLYNGFLNKDRKLRYVLRDSVLYRATKSYDGNSDVRFSHLCTVELYNARTGAFKYSYREGLTDYGRKTLRENPIYKDVIVKDMRYFYSDGFEFVTDEEAKTFMIEQLYKRRKYDD